MILQVTRDSEKNDKQTLGKAELIDNGVTVMKCETLELPDKNNQKQISCIPKGEYNCIKVPPTANIPYEHISIQNVPNRDGVCVHAANFYTQLRGCIAVGKERIDLNNDGLKDITDSKKTFDLLMFMTNSTFKLIIK